MSIKADPCHVRFAPRSVGIGFDLSHHGVGGLIERILGSRRVGYPASR